MRPDAMDIHHLGTQIVIILVAVAFLWLLFKVIKLFWKLTLIFMIFLVLSFLFPAVREWVFNLF